ncbi:MAG: DUF1320 domain-containing protein [Proteobacteria bacterium]|nr:DUF1320 domain-containing protein [Pseudomonadota bacterium]
MYINRADIEEAITPTIVVQLTDDEGTGAQVDARVSAAITTAQGKADAYCSKRYAVPFVTPPQVIKDVTVTLAVNVLYSRRLGAPEHWKTKNSEALDFLADVSSGKASLGANAPQPANDANITVSTSAPRNFTREGMGGL